MKKLLDQIAKFGVVGVLCFFIDFGLYNICNYIFDVMNMPEFFYMVSGVVGFVVSMVVNYLLSMKYVFVRRDDISRSHEFIVFFVLSAFGLVINEIVLYVGVDMIFSNWKWLQSWMSRNMAEVFFKLAATGIVMVYNFISRKMTLEQKPVQEEN